MEHKPLTDKHQMVNTGGEVYLNRCKKDAWEVDMVFMQMYLKKVEE